MNIQNLTDKDFIKINEIKNNKKDKTKPSIKWLKKYSLLLWDQETTDKIFDPNDTCLCSVNHREQYKLKFFKKYDEELNNIQF